MPMEPKNKPGQSRISLLLTVLAGFAIVIYSSAVVFRPDRPIATIVPGSSSGPAFVVQIIRPRLGLPLGGILPAQLFGFEASLSFDSTSPGATIGRVDAERMEFAADEWELVLTLDGDGHVSAESYVVFKLMFENRLRKLRCLPDDPAVGTLNSTALATTGQLSGSFDIELAHCEDADTGEPIGWPPRPLILHGSFDQLTPDAGAERR